MMGATMATIIDFAQMRKVLAERPGRSRRSNDGPPEGQVILFTGIRYERCDSGFDNLSSHETSNVPSESARKKKS